MDFALSISNYIDVPLDKYEKDFTFIVNDKHYKTSRQIADILSPNLRKFHYSDESINEITIHPKEPQSDEIDYFQNFLNLPIERYSNIDLQTKLHYAEYFYLLGNINEFLIIQQNNYDKITSDNAIDRLLFILQIEDKIPSSSYQNAKLRNSLITFISSNFYKFTTDQLKKIPVEAIEEIISNRKLQIKDEDSLLSFILDLYKEDNQNFFLFEYVQFKNVSSKLFEKFFGQFDVNDINQTIWLSLCSCFLSTKSSKSRHPPPKKKLQTRYAKIDHEGEIPTSESDLSLDEMLSRIDFRDGIPVGLPTNYDNNQNETENENENENEGENENEDENENGYPIENDDDDDNEVFNLSDNTGVYITDPEFDQNNYLYENRHVILDDENDSSYPSDDLDNQDVENFDLYKRIISLFRESKVLSNENLPKIVHCLHQIAVKMDQICTEKVSHQYLDPHFIFIDENFEPDMSRILIDPELINSEKFIFDIFWAPEIIGDFQINQKSDVYSFAVLAFFMFTGKYPFSGKNPPSVVNLISGNKRDTIPDFVPQFIQNLIQICWQQAPEARPSFSEIAEILSNSDLESNDIENDDNENVNNSNENDENQENNENNENQESNENDENQENNENQERNENDENDENQESNENDENQENNENNENQENNENNENQESNENNENDENQENHEKDENNENQVANND